MGGIFCPIPAGVAIFAKTLRRNSYKTFQPILQVPRRTAPGEWKRACFIPLERLVEFSVKFSDRGTSMSVSGILGSNNPYQLGATSALQQQFQQLGQALQSGNLSAAQSDFATLQAAFSQPGTSTGATTNSSSAGSPIAQALNQLSSDLQSGNLSAAQKDYSTMQQDLHGANGTAAHHHHFGGGGGGGSSIDTLLQELSQTGQSSSSSSLSAAQQGYTTLQQELQQFALSGVSLASEAPISLDV